MKSDFYEEINAINRRNEFLVLFFLDGAVFNGNVSTKSTKLMSKLMFKNLKVADWQTTQWDHIDGSEVKATVMPEINM